jgi:soluble lytic murein transglycosylase-like protein
VIDRFAIPADYGAVNIGLKSRIAAGLTAAGLILLLPAAGYSAGFSARLKAQYDPLIQTISMEEGIKAEFVHAVIKAESAYNKNAISRAGAQGLMQLMPATAAAYGVKDVFDPEDNIRGGVKFLKVLLRLYNQDTKLALAAYNAGQEAVKKYGDVPPYPETKAYIKRVMSTFNAPPTRTRIYEYKDENGKTVLTNDPRLAAQYGVVDPN